MINRIIDISVKHKTLLLVAVALACLAGWRCMMTLPLDATPNLIQTQVILYSRWDRSPDIIEDQVTYPIVTTMVGAPKVKTVRGVSDFGYSYVYVVFEDGTDLYWARSRTLEYLSGVLSQLPEGVKVELGPDATSLGWVFQYALVDSSTKHSLADLRSYQDWSLRYYLKTVPGVAAVAPVGGYRRQSQRNGENALEVIDRVKQKLREIEPTLPEGVKIVPVYDRSELIHRAISSVKTTIFEVVATVVLIVLVFLWHFPSAAIPIITMPVVVLLSFIPLRLLGISANIMSLAGVAIAFGELVDASIVVAEQTHKKLEAWEKMGRRQDYRTVILSAVKEVAAPTFFALLVIAISFLPVLTLEAQEGRMFKPLAYSKTLAMLIASGMAITFDPALRLLLTRVEPFGFRPAWLCRAVNALPAGPKVRPTLLRYPCLKRWSSSSRAPSGAVSPPGTPHGRRRPPSPFFATSLPTRFLQRNSFASWTRPSRFRA